MVRPDSPLLGFPFGADGSGAHTGSVLRCAFPAWGGRGRFFSRDHCLLHSLVQQSRPGPSALGVGHGCALQIGPGRTGLGALVEVELAGSVWLEMAVSPGRIARGLSG